MAGFTFMLAPMEDMTSNAFRTLCHRYGADLTFTEMVRVGALAINNRNTWSRIEFRDDTPTVIQLIGSNEQHFSRFLGMFEPANGFRGFNLNLGCPSPEVVKLGQGCAMVRKVSKTARIAALIRNRGFPFSIKMRLGMNSNDKEYKVYLKIINAVDADFYVVHARHGLQTYAHPADFGVYEECARNGKAIIANGDISTIEQVERLKSMGVRGVMIGRAAVIDPTIFNKLKGLPGRDTKSMQEEYLALSDRFGEPPKYRNSVLRRMGHCDMKNFDRE